MLATQKSPPSIPPSPPYPTTQISSSSSPGPLRSKNPQLIKMARTCLTARLSAQKRVRWADAEPSSDSSSDSEYDSDSEPLLPPPDSSSDSDSDSEPLLPPKRPRIGIYPDHIQEKFANPALEISHWHHGYPIFARKGPDHCDCNDCLHCAETLGFETLKAYRLHKRTLEQQAYLASRTDLPEPEVIDLSVDFGRPSAFKVPEEEVVDLTIDSDEEADLKVYEI